MTRTTTYALMTVTLIAAMVACPSLADARGGFGGHGGSSGGHGRSSGGHGRSSSHGMQRRVSNSPAGQHRKNFSQTTGQTRHGTQTQPGNTANKFAKSGIARATHHGGTSKKSANFHWGNGHHGHHGYWGHYYPWYRHGGFGGFGPTRTVIQPLDSQVIQAVNEEPIVQPPAGRPIDLELIEVRQLDLGDSAMGQGPAYRVMLRSRTGEAVTQPFDVGLAASIGRQANAESAFAVTRVDGLAAGQTLTVEIRLPADALNLGQNADGQPVPFGFLTAVADANQELPEADRTNDFLTLRRGGIVMVVQK